MSRAKLFAPEYVWALSKNKFETGGCGPYGWKILDLLIPDNLLGLNIVDCCRIHDAMYSAGTDGLGLAGDDAHKRFCDRVFLNNMQREITAASYPWYLPGLRWARKRFSWRYYQAVSHFGGPAYYEGKNSVQEFRGGHLLPGKTP